MSFNLRALLADSEPETHPVPQPAAPAHDPLADKPLHLALTLSPSPTLATRMVQGTLGEPGKMPRFIQESVTVAELGQLLETLYTAYAQQAEVEALQAVSAETKRQILATASTVVQTNEATNTLDIF